MVVKSYFQDIYLCSSEKNWLIHSMLHSSNRYNVTGLILDPSHSPHIWQQASVFEIVRASYDQGGGLWLRYLLHFPFLQVKIFDYYNNSEYDTRCLYQYYCKNTVKINDLISEPVGIRAQNLFMRYFLMQHRK